MQSFKDSVGREWVLRLDAPTIREVRRDCDGIDLANLDGAAFTRLATDPCLLVDVVWVLCREQAERLAVTDRQFGQALTGGAIEAATSAMLGVVADFFPPSKGNAIRAMIAKRQEIEAIGYRKVLEKIESPHLMDRIVGDLDRALGLADLMPSSNATNSPGSAG